MNINSIHNQNLEINTKNTENLHTALKNSTSLIGKFQGKQVYLVDGNFKALTKSQELRLKNCANVNLVAKEHIKEYCEILKNHSFGSVLPGKLNLKTKEFEMHKESLATHRNTNASENEKIMNLLQNYEIIPKNVSNQQLEQTLLDISENPPILNESAAKTIDMPSKATTEPPELVYLEITPEPLVEEFVYPELINVEIPTHNIQFEQLTQTNSVEIPNNIVQFEQLTQTNTVELPNNTIQSEQLTQTNSAVTAEDPLVDEFLNPETRPKAELANKEAITTLTILSSEMKSKAIGSLNDQLRKGSTDKIFNDLHNYSKFLFKNIQSQELNKHITKLNIDTDNEYCGNVASIIYFSDKLASTISESVLSSANLKEAQKKLDSWMNLGDKAIKNNDFQLANLIYATFGSAPIYRLLNEEQKIKQDEITHKYLIMGTKSDSEVLKQMKSPGSIPFMGYYKSKFEFHQSSHQDIRTLKTEILKQQETVNYTPEKEKTGIINLMNQYTIGSGNFKERSNKLKPRKGLAS